MRSNSDAFSKLRARRLSSDLKRNKSAYCLDPSREKTPQVFSPKEAARRLGTSLPTIYRLLRGGELSGVKVGGQWRISDASLQKYLEDGIRMPGN